MSVDNLYPDTNITRFSARNQMNAWRLQEDLTRIDSFANDFASGFPLPAINKQSETNWQDTELFGDLESEPLRKFQTAAPRRIIPTPLEELYSQSISRAEVTSEEQWQTLSDGINIMDSGAEEKSYSGQTGLDSTASKQTTVPEAPVVPVNPLDMFSLPGESTASAVPAPTVESLEALKRPLELQGGNQASLLEESPSLLEEKKTSQTANSGRRYRRPMLCLGVGMLVCGLGIILGAQLVGKPALINPAKALAIAGIVGVITSTGLQSFRAITSRVFAQ